MAAEATMSKRVWAATLITLALIGACYAALSRPSPDLRSQHSLPAVIVPSAMVVVTDRGKLFHRPECKYIHNGERKTMSAADAVAQGYTPCTRCYRDALGR